MPSAPGLTPSGERWLQRITPLSSMTNSVRADSPIFSLKAPYFLETVPLGSKSARTGKFSFRSFENARWDQILSMEYLQITELCVLYCAMTNVSNYG